MKKKNAIISRILILAAFMFMMLLLCGCRVRVSNNSEVLSTLEDDGGWLQETYQERRDELGIPVAKEPLINRDSGEDYDSEDYEDDEYYDEEDEEYYEEEDDEYDDEYDDEDEEDEDGETYSPARRTATERTLPQVRTPVQQQRTPIRRPATPVVVGVRVTFDLNADDAKCSATGMTVRKGYTYGTLPVPTREGYDFKGWFTAKSGGKEVTSQTKVNDDKAHTLYAHWKKAEKKKYKVSFVKNVPEEDEDKVTLNKDEIKVEEGGKYGGLEKMPSPKWDKHKFEGWYTEADEGAGTKVKSSDKFSGTSDQTLYAHWSDDTLGWWNKRFEETANNIEPESKVIIALDEGDDHDKKLVDECKGKLAEEGETPEYIVKIIKNYSEESAKTTAEEVYNTVSAEKPGVKVIILSDEVHKGSDEQKLLYKMMLMDAIYGSFGSDLDSAAADLDATVFYPYVYSKDAGAEEPGIEEIDTEEQGTQGTEEPGVEVIDTENQGVEEISTVN